MNEDFGCNGCFPEVKARVFQLDQIQKKAKEYANEKKITVAVFEDQQGYGFIEAGAAIAGSYPIRSFISFD